MSITGYRLRVTEGEFKGLWLSRIDLHSKSGMPYRIVPDWQEVANHPERYRITPKFGRETAAWLGLNKEAAQRFRKIVSSAGIQTEIVAP